MGGNAVSLSSKLEALAYLLITWSTAMPRIVYRTTISLAKQFIKHTPLYHLLRNWGVKRRQVKELENWSRNGRPVPVPHIIKQQTLLHYAKNYSLKVLVETGTHYGDMIYVLKTYFDHIYSIELRDELFYKAKKRFKKESNIEFIHGDSGTEIKNLMNKIKEPTLFWLDGHYSGEGTARGKTDTPIYKELNNILSGQSRGHVIIIDDARLFGTDPAYPTLEELKWFIKSKSKDVYIFVQDDMIRIIQDYAALKDGN
jgi:hypothetical protein